jgi:hypothetical protein
MRFPLSYDATISRADFVRLLPRATNAPAVTEVDGAFCGNGWQVRLTPLSPLVIGLFRLERHHVEVSLAGRSADDQDRFMHHFTQCYQRGGG